MCPTCGQLGPPPREPKSDPKRATASESSAGAASASFVVGHRGRRAASVWLGRGARSGGERVAVAELCPYERRREESMHA